MKQEIRTLRFDGAEFRAEETEGVKKIRGYPIVFNSPGTPYRGSEWTEVVDPAALQDVDFAELRLLMDHDTGKVLAKAGINLRAEADKIGLFIEATLPDTTLARDAWELIRLKIIDGMSFRFRADKWETDTVKKQDRIMHMTEVPEVSVVTFPAYTASSVIATDDQRHQEEKQAEGGDDDRKRAESLLDIYLT